MTLNGETIINIQDVIMSLDPNAGPESIIGRGLVIHGGQDDLGLGGDAGSVASGNAGPRVACGIVEYSEYKDTLAKTIHHCNFNCLHCSYAQDQGCYNGTV